MSLVLDCSVVCGFIFENQRTPYALRVAEVLKQRQGLVPSLFVFEIANVLMTQERRKQWSSEATAEFWRLLEQWRLRVGETGTLHQGRGLLALARRHQLSAYDAGYLALALEYRFPLATQDALLKKAAISEGLFFEE